MTSVRSSVSVVLGNDGVSRHVSHLRRVPGTRDETRERSIVAEDDDDEGHEVPAEQERRYPTRDRSVTQRFGMEAQDVPVYV